MSNYYVRPAAAHGNTPDGLTYETAWLGWTNVLWGAGVGSVSGGDTLYFCGAHTFTAASMLVGNSGATDGNETILRGDYLNDAGSATFVTSGNVSHGRSHFKIINISITQTASPAAIFLGAIDNTEFNGLTITGGADGIKLSSSSGDTHSNLTITNCSFSGHSDKALDFLASGTNFTTTLDTITITNNTFDGEDTSNEGIYLRFEADQNAASKMSSILIDNNTFTGYTGSVIRVADEVTTGAPTSEDCIISNNTISNNGIDTSGTGIALRGFGDSDGDYGENLVIKNNNISNQTGNGGGINVWYNKGLIIEDNICTNMICATGGIDSNGILLDWGNTNVIVRKNTIDTCLGLAGSIVTHNSGCAVMILYGNANMQVEGNRCSNTKHGLFIGNEASGAIVANVCNNRFLNCIDNGVIVASGNINPENNQFKNNILTEKVGETATPVYDNSGAVGDLDEDYNIFYSFTNASQNHTDGSNDITSDPDLDAADDLMKTSPAIGVGFQWWSGANPEGYNGEPFSNFDIDIGDTQYTYGPFHPKNL